MAEQLREGLWLLELGFVAPLASNAYLLDDGGDVTLVDSGLPRNWPTLRSELAAAGYEVGDVDRVLLTHYDLDHVGGLARLRPEFDGPVYVGRDDLRLVHGEDDPSVFHHKGAFHRLARVLFPFPADVDVHPVTDGETFDGFTAFHTPGHNPGHTVYLHESGVAFLGDLVWEEDAELTTPIWFDSYDVREIDESVKGLVDRIPPFEVAAMGHGDPIRSRGHAALLALADRL
ncbi:MBL fold metallo-hydrolase [Haloarculaceae archaeon H-GB2-1]|nr:MBL fold metallo-hydrolase [Haloarculaceae archaeon H-GB1-1]MEA5385851.1 MBL fold metallo-hydrolase [Haloarculaceae archaeon H-GB11]MEA5407354.1 MBL fold metallo-hydrolase [Haloarculaceae archaeon H-GB2-1]